MPSTLNGSCHCGAVEFTFQSSTPVPYQICGCSICRKVGGYGGSVNLGGYTNTLKIKKGEELIKKYTPVKNRNTPQQELYTSERNFCSTCSSMLWLWDKTYPDLIHPFASAIDTELPTPEEMVCVMGNSKPKWVRWPEGKKTVCTQYNGGTSIEAWHKERGLYVY